MIHVRSLDVDVAATRSPVLRGVSIDAGPGSRIGVVGESGSGKSTLLRAITGAVQRGLVVTAGTVELDGVDVFGVDDDERRGMWGTRVALVPQAVGLSLTPHLDVAAHFRDVVMNSDGGRGGVDRERVTTALDDVGLQGARMLHRFPHEMSGGEQQRVLIALGLARDPSVLLLDEPTSALDVGIAHDIVTMLLEQQARRGFTMVVVSHDLSMIRTVAEHVVVMQAGQVMEQGPTAEVAVRPQHPYTRRLLDAAPRLGQRHAGRAATPSGGDDVLDVRGLTVTRRRLGRGASGRQATAATTALDGVSLRIRRGEILGVIGESGSGKSTLLRTVCGLLHAAAGELRLDGTTDLSVPLSRRPQSVLRRVQMVFQNPDDSLNPAHTVRRVLSAGRAADDAELGELLGTVGLDSTMLDRRPAQLSGGEKQRVAIARALAQEPELLLLDEVTSALDVTVQAEVLSTLLDIHRRRGTTMMFVSHDIAVVAAIADRIAVLRNGRLLEIDDVETVIERAADPYTQSLVRLAKGN